MDDDSFAILSQDSVRLRREKWDRRFIDMMNVVGSWSKDPSTKVGAVIVRPDLTVAAVGYNGFPRGMSDADELYEHRPTKYSRIVHGEMNAILNAHGTVEGCTLYVPFPPCDRCAVHVVQAGIKRVVYVEPTEDIKSRWSEAFEMTAAIFKDAGMEVTVLPLPEENTDPFLSEETYLADTVDITVRFVNLDGEHGINRHVVCANLSRFNGVGLDTTEEQKTHIEKIGAAAVNVALGKPA